MPGLNGTDGEKGEPGRTGVPGKMVRLFNVWTTRAIEFMAFSLADCDCVVYLFTKPLCSPNRVVLVVMVTLVIQVYLGDVDCLVKWYDFVFNVLKSYNLHMIAKDTL